MSSVGGMRIVILTALISSIIPSMAFLPPFGSNISATAQSALSASELHSDFNGDGYEDLAIGAADSGITFLENQGGETFGNSLFAGAVHVLYGSSSGLQTASPADQFWHQNSPGISNSVEKFDFFGDALAAGDFNSDGFADLAVGVPGEGIAGIERVGAVHILYGTSSGLQTSSPPQQFWHENSPGVEDTEETDDHFGYLLTVGNFNGDGFIDLAIGVADAVHVLYGSSSGLRTSAPADQLFAEERAGSLAAGDFNNDGFCDLAIGMPELGWGGATTAGSVHVIYGSSSGLQTSSPADQLWDQDSPGVPDVTDRPDDFGFSLASGDFNNDGFFDLAIGNPSEDVLHADRAEGSVHVIYGSASGLQTSSPASQFWTENSPNVEDSPECCDQYGYSLSAGDFNNDGVDDLAVGALEENLGSTKSRAGAVNVLFGSSSGLQATSPADQFWTQDSPGVEDNSEQSDHFGSALTASDFNNDGFGDLAIGVDGEGLNANSFRAGAVNVLYGSTSGLQTASPLDQFWNQNSPGVEDTAESDDGFGSNSLA